MSNRWYKFYYMAVLPLFLFSEIGSLLKLVITYNYNLINFALFFLNYTLIVLFLALKITLTIYSMIMLRKNRGYKENMLLIWIQAFPSFAFQISEFTTYYLLLISIVMAIITSLIYSIPNFIYFKKRKFMFTQEITRSI